MSGRSQVLATVTRGAVAPHPRSARPSAAAPILERPVFERLLFAQCWDDPRLDAEALRAGPGHTVLSVTSGGCNTLALALQGASRVIAIDLNGAQSALLELKIAGARSLDHSAYLEFLGARTSRRRAALYRKCRTAMPARAQDYWDRKLGLIESGVLRAGRYERYLDAFRRLLWVLEGGRRVERLFTLRSLEEQRRFYETEWNTTLWRLFFRLFFSRGVLGLGGLDPSFFAYVEDIDDFGDHFLERARHALAEIPVRDNYFLAQICLGGYREDLALPPYLEAHNFRALQEAVERVEVMSEELGAFLARQPDESIDRFNLSNIFEWVPSATFERMLRAIYRVARPGARLCYRNLLVRRRHPDSFKDRFEAEDDLAARLLRADRSFVYAHFEIARVRKPA